MGMRQTSAQRRGGAPKGERVDLRMTDGARRIG